MFHIPEAPQKPSSEFPIPVVYKPEVEKLLLTPEVRHMAQIDPMIPKLVTLFPDEVKQLIKTPRGSTSLLH